MKPRFSKYYLYSIIFVSAPLLLLLVYALRGVYPFGRGSVLALDLNAQYIYYYEAFRDAILGDRSLLYSFSRTLGGEMVGLYAYYLASPFTFVLLFFPKKLLTEAVLVMILLKTGAAALSFALYLKASRKAKPVPMFLFSLMYALMAYIIVQTMNPMWLDGPIFLPLIILAVERLVERGRFGLLVVSLAAMFMANFYIGYMVGIFTAVYFFYYLYVGSAALAKQEKVKRFCNFAGASVLATGGSLWLLLPTYYSLKMGKFGFTSPDFTPRQQLDLFDIFSKMLPLTYDSVNYPGHPFIYCGLLTLLLVVLYFIARSIPPRRKRGAAALIGIFILCFTVSTVDIALHGFQGPNWLNYRYSFILSFFLLAFAYEAYTAVKEIERAAMGRACLALLVLAAFIGKLGYEYIKPEKTIWSSYAGLVIYTLLLLGLKESGSRPYFSFKWKRPFAVPRRRLLEAALIVVASLELVLNANALIAGAHAEVYYSDRPSYRDYFERLYPAVDYIKGQDKSFYRAETVLRRTVNDPMALGIYGVSHSSSTLNSKVIDLMYRLGFSSREHWTRYKGATPLSDSLLGIKYVIAESPPNNLYEPLYSENGITVFRNPYALPVAFPVHRDYAGLELDSPDPFVNQNALLSAMLGRPGEEFFKLLPIKEFIFENMTGTEEEGGYVSYRAINPAENAHLEYILGTAGENEMHMYLYSEYPRKVNLWLEHEYLDTFFDYESTCIMPLGAHPEKESISLITTPVEGEYYLNQNMFYYLDTPLFEAALEELRRKEARVDKISETRLKITVGAAEGEVLFTSIPFEEGWRVRVNGEKAWAFRAAGALLAVELAPGRQVVELTFIPSGLLPGSAVSLAAWAIFAGLMIHRRRKAARKEVA
ncbi:MAG: YfhO family protein [Firmicutes bacterium]|jgi:uncharacterized membrane protein YfhO|nr:YfhO family protein [Bacillota bacterium]HPU00784.1 YfhO family protein [Bacillota bacterium]